MKKEDIIAWIHFLWIMLTIVSLPLLFVFPWFKYITIIIVSINILSWVAWRDCFLLKWEKDLRGEKAYEGAFIFYYLKKYFSINISTVAVRILVYVYTVLLIVLIIFL